MLNQLLRAALASTLLIAGGCSKLEPPGVVPRDAKVTALGPEGLDVLVAVEATNPNRVPLTVRSVTAKATLDGKWPLGAVTIPQAVTLPPSTPTLVQVPLKMTLTDLQSLAAVALANRPVPFLVEGTVNVGGERLNVDVPFQMPGTISREQLAGMAARALPQLPGLPR